MCHTWKLFCALWYKLGRCMRAVAGPIAEKLSTNDPAEPAGVELSEDLSTLCIREKNTGKSENEVLS